MHHMAPVLVFVLMGFLHYVRLAAHVSCSIILLMRWIYGTFGIKMMIISVFHT